MDSLDGAPRPLRTPLPPAGLQLRAPSTDRSMVSLGSSLMRGLLVMFLARLAYLAKSEGGTLP